MDDRTSQNADSTIELLEDEIKMLADEHLYLTEQIRLHRNLAAVHERKAERLQAYIKGLKREYHEIISESD